MEIINIETSTYDLLISYIERVIDKVEQTCKLTQNKGLEDWLDNQEVCTILNISPRALQYYRERELISFSKIEKKIFYKGSEVNEFLKNRQR